MRQKNAAAKTRIKLTPTHQLMCALALFAAATLVSRGAGMHPWEISFFTAVYNWPDFLHPVFFAVTQLGSVHALAILLLGFLLAKRYHIVLKLLMTAALAYLVTGLAKDMWGRVRPHEFLLNVVNLDYVVRGPGYPSGHMALATAMALVVGYHLPRAHRWILVILLAAVGLSRMYLGIHAPLDIIGGFAIGWAAYALVRHVRIYNNIKRR